MFCVMDYSVILELTCCCCFLYGNCYRYGHAYHRVVSCSDESHHLYVCRY